MLKNLYYLVYLFFFGLIFACSTAKDFSANQLKSGDLIFVEARQKQLSGAINRVTQLSEEENFDHVGLVEVTQQGVFVLHASVKQGSNKESLANFYNKNVENNQQMVAYRLHQPHRHHIKPAIEQAHSMLGKPYNLSYVLDEQRYYCSDFVERAFREGAVFEHIPMNFRNPETGAADEFWVGFYEQLGRDVPQGEPGTNPNQLARSDKLKRLGHLEP